MRGTRRRRAPRSASRKLPSGLIEHILLYVDRSNGLQECSLVCKAWVAPARRRLFENLRFKQAFRAYNIVLRQLLAFLDANPDVCAAVKTFEFSHTRSLTLTPTPHAHLPLALQVLSILPHLHTIAVDNICFRVIEEEMPDFYPTELLQCHARTLRAQRMNFCPSPTLHLSGLLRHLPSLRQLHLEDCGDFGGDKYPLQLRSTLRLDSLTIIDMMSSAASSLNAVALTSTVQQLECLTVDEQDTPVVKPLKNMLYSVRSGLRKLDMRCETPNSEYESRPKDELIADFDGLLSLSTSLEELTVHVYFGSGKMPTLSWAQTARTLSSLRAARLAVLTLAVAPRGDLTANFEYHCTPASVTDWDEIVPWESIYESIAGMRSLQVLRIRGEMMKEDTSPYSDALKYQPEPLDRAVRAYVRVRFSNRLPRGARLIIDDEV